MYTINMFISLYPDTSDLLSQSVLSTGSDLSIGVTSQPVENGIAPPLPQRPPSRGTGTVGLPQVSGM